ncbi:J domain-containing protein [Mycena sanguinolenta]|uniref:J domain-containing protein n=1 Tax=Mycena sanguinolenta TaxID=230812 RepID=A0A8H6YHF2_9AGAR|nr:J domain-containing protein [Mycena sanguinolenta]
MLSLLGFFVLLLTVNCDAVQFNQVPLAAADEWDLKTFPSPNASGHLVFDSVNSLLSHWPNTKYHSGHAIVPGTIPTGTLLYHGRGDPDIPRAREWASFDSEFARLFCLEPVNCWVLTLVATRPLRVLYFDGHSATKIPDGPMDTQDLLAWGAVRPERATLEWEYKRLNRLCDTLGFDAFVRMQLNFEVMLCSFTDGVQTQTLARLEDEPRFPHYAYAFMHSSTWHDHYPGETRVQLDLTHARREHRVLGIDERDARAVLARVQAIPSHPSRSGIDWRTLLHGIRDRYAARLEALQVLLTENTSPKRAFVLIQSLLAPYRLHSAVVPPPTRGSDTTWAAPVFRLCSTAHTLFAESESVQASLTASEHLLLSSARETNREICRTLVGMWAEGVTSSLSDERLTRRWRAEVERLMDWLGWDAWTKCRPECVFPESCYLPGPPFSMKEWNNSTPRCIRLFQPYSDFPEPELQLDI